MSLFACALYVFMGMWSLGKSPPQWLSQLPVAIIGLTVLLGILQPEMGWEVHVGVGVGREGLGGTGRSKEGGPVTRYSLQKECSLL